ncbi:3-oxoacyl-ACP synthase III family protein [Streptococcus sp. 27098_8_74]|jgi:3-oxoacyl-[acyl-carrier-protein] synthase 3|uniref:3-oxoacyl-ACP synthase III family protein n=1 Tax=Streptococcus sp. 27098_8_74 TaxID=3003646 RepID=UPI00290050EE|nr:beta-ketoacyl-ACP synthase III [Streptococcus salivarius]
MYYSKIIGIGHYVPENVVTNKDLEKTLDTTDEWIKQKIGIKQRHIANEEEVSSDLGYRASIEAISDANINVDEIDMIVLATNTPDHLSPATAIQIQKKIGAKNAFGFDIRVGGCPGLIYSLAIASKFISDGSCKNVLVVTVDLNSRWINWEERLTAVIMGDGASAVVLQASESPDRRIVDIDLNTNPEGYYDAFVPAGGSVEPISIDAIKNKRHYFNMDGRKIYNFATKVFPTSVRTLVERNGYSITDIDAIIPHQANINIIKESMSRLGLPIEKAYCNIDMYGNTGGSSVGIALSEAVKNQFIKSGDIVVLVAYGAGNSWGSILIEF